MKQITATSYFFNRGKFVLFLFLSSLFAGAQKPEILFIKKESTALIFFQKNKQNDTVVSGANDLFYFVVPDSVKEDVFISVDNGQFTKTRNDSLIRLAYMPGLTYEYSYIRLERQDSEAFQGEQAKWSGGFQTLIAGTNQVSAGKIIVRIKRRFSQKIIFEKSFVAKPAQ